MKTFNIFLLVSILLKIVICSVFNNDINFTLIKNDILSGNINYDYKNNNFYFTDKLDENYLKNSKLYKNIDINEYIDNARLQIKYNFRQEIDNIDKYNHILNNIKKEPYTNMPILHSNLNCKAKIYLNFQGYINDNTDNIWDYYDALPFNPENNDFDNGTAYYNNYEQIYIYNIWQRIKEDFAVFNIDITTEKPEFNKKSIHCLITERIGRNEKIIYNRAVLGVAYLNIFNKNKNLKMMPAFVFYNNIRKSSAIAEIASHEIGHNLGLLHDGDSKYAYHYGFKSPTWDSWGTIMGLTMGRNITQWSNGDYFDANNLQDDIAILSRKIGLLVDDYNTTINNPATIEFTYNFHLKGLINNINDIDVFKLYYNENNDNNNFENNDNNNFENDDENSGSGINIYNIGATKNQEISAIKDEKYLNILVRPFKPLIGEGGHNLDFSLNIIAYKKDKLVKNITLNLEKDNFVNYNIFLEELKNDYKYFISISSSGNYRKKYSNYGSLGEYNIIGNVNTFLNYTNKTVKYYIDSQMVSLNIDNNCKKYVFIFCLYNLENKNSKYIDYINEKNIKKKSKKQKRRNKKLPSIKLIEIYKKNKLRYLKKININSDKECLIFNKKVKKGDKYLISVDFNGSWFSDFNEYDLNNCIN